MLSLPIASTWCHGGAADHGVRGRRLTQELHVKDAELRAKDVELRELKEERSAMLLRYVREFTELQKRQASTTKMLEASAALLQKAGDTIGC